MIGNGFSIIKADNNRLAGWNVIHSYLEYNLTAGIQPKLKVFRNCAYLIESLPGLIRDEKNPEDVDTRGDDHAADALRYGLMSKPVVSKKPTRNAPKNSFVAHMERMEQARRSGGYVGAQ